MADEKRFQTVDSGEGRRGEGKLKYVNDDNVQQYFRRTSPAFLANVLRSDCPNKGRRIKEYLIYFRKVQSFKASYIKRKEKDGQLSMGKRIN